MKDTQEKDPRDDDPREAMSYHIHVAESQLRAMNALLDSIFKPQSR